MPSVTNSNALTGAEIAIIGMDGRFPAAPSLEDSGKTCKRSEAISFLEKKTGSSRNRSDLLKNPHYI